MAYEGPSWYAIGRYSGFNFQVMHDGNHRLLLFTERDAALAFAKLHHESLSEHGEYEVVPVGLVHLEEDED